MEGNEKSGREREKQELRENTLKELKKHEI